MKAPGYRRLRTVPRGTSVRIIIAGVLGLAIISGAAIAGTFPAQALPGWIGSVRVLLGVIGAVLGASSTWSSASAASAGPATPP